MANDGKSDPNNSIEPDPNMGSQDRFQCLHGRCGGHALNFHLLVSVSVTLDDYSGRQRRSEPTTIAVVVWRVARRRS